jgi:hypothetical protein
MKKLTWWFRIVGAFYLLLTLMNLYGIFINPQFYRDQLGIANDLATKTFIDAWMAFVMDMLVIGGFLLWASRDPLKHLSVVWFVVLMEVFHGIVDDLFLIARGYDAAGYLVFSGIHLVIIVTGVVFAREASARAMAKVSEPLKTS